MCRLSWNLGSSTSWNPQGLSRPVMGLLYLLPVRGGLIICIMYVLWKRTWLWLISQHFGNFLSIVYIKTCVPEWQWKFCNSRVRSNCMFTIAYRCKHAEVYVVKTAFGSLSLLMYSRCIICHSIWERVVLFDLRQWFLTWCYCIIYFTLNCWRVICVVFYDVPYVPFCFVCAAHWPSYYIKRPTDIFVCQCWRERAVLIPFYLSSWTLESFEVVLEATERGIKRILTSPTPRVPVGATVFN
jgi:hypothetical protein